MMVMTCSPQLSFTYDDEARQDEEVNDEESNEESDDESNKESDEEVQGANIEEEGMGEEATHEEDEANELYRDVGTDISQKDEKTKQKKADKTGHRESGKSV
ncbi:hypothetical protein Tco_1103362 [Tanacetum coccineum]